MEQLDLFEKLNTEEKTACAFTGHRELKDDFSPKKLEEAIIAQLEEGVRVFYNGMAMGFDLLAAEYVLECKKKYEDVKLIACIPCLNQEKYFSDKDKKRYVSVLKKCDEQVLVSESYYNGCMQKRDRYMVDRADVLITYCKKSKGGTAYTVRYFKKKYPKKPILFL